MTDGRKDGQTDGIAIASTALAMRELRRAVISNNNRLEMSRDIPSLYTQGQALAPGDIVLHDVFGRPFVKRFALCYRTVVCLSVCPICL